MGSGASSASRPPTELAAAEGGLADLGPETSSNPTEPRAAKPGALGRLTVFVRGTEAAVGRFA